MMNKATILTVLCCVALGLAKSTTASHDDDKIVFVEYHDTFLLEESYAIVKANLLQEASSDKLPQELLTYANNQGFDQIRFFSSSGWTENPTKATTYDLHTFYTLITAPKGQAAFKIKNNHFYENFVVRLKSTSKPQTTTQNLTKLQGQPTTQQREIQSLTQPQTTTQNPTKLQGQPTRQQREIKILTQPQTKPSQTNKAFYTKVILSVIATCLVLYALYRKHSQAQKSDRARANATS